MNAPFPGLAPFTESDSDHERFVGRDQETRLIAANMLASRLTVLYGPAGVGKSSVLRAGLVHRLRQDVAGALRVVVVYVDSWSDDPAHAILDALAAEAERLGLADDPPPADLPLDDALEAWADRLKARVLLVLDQFEEYCLYHPPDAHPLDRELPLAIERDDVDIRVLVALREDALAMLDRYKGRVPGLFANRYRLDNLTADVARQAIERPIERYNAALAPDDPDRATIEDGLIDTVIAEIAPGAVALATQGRGIAISGEARVETAYLQLVMAALWNESHTLRIATLRRMGGATGIVRAHVDAIAGSLSGADQAVAARALHFLVTPSGSKIAHNARDLATYANVDQRRLARVLERLSEGDSRLLRPLSELDPDAGPRFEVYHDVLAPAILDWRARFLAQRQQRRLAPMLSLIVALVIALAGTALYATDPGWVHDAESGTADARQSIGAPVPGAGDYAVVSFDRSSLDALGQAWPVDRRIHARMLDSLRETGASVIAYDVEFREAGPDAAADRELQAAIQRAGARLVLAGYTFGDDNALSLFGKLGPGETSALVEELGTRTGYTGIPLEDDQVYRTVEAAVRFPEEQSPTVPTFSFVAAQLSGSDVSPWQGAIDIDFGGGPGTLRTVRAADVLEGDVDLAGKIVVVGAEEADSHLTPTGDQLMPGAEIQANAIATVRARERDSLRDIVLIALLALAPCAFIRARVAVAVAGIVLVGIAYGVLALLLWNTGTVIPVAIPLAALTLSALGMLAIRLRLRERRHPATPSATGPGAAPAQAPGRPRVTVPASRA